MRGRPTWHDLRCDTHLLQLCIAQITFRIGALLSQYRHGHPFGGDGRRPHAACPAGSVFGALRLPVQIHLLAYGVQLHDAGNGGGGQRGGGQDGDYEDVPSSGSEEEENIALLGKSDPRKSDFVNEDKESKSKEQLNSVEENKKNENRERIVESSAKAARPNRANQELCKVLQEEQEEKISGGIFEANLLSRGVSGLYFLLLMSFSIFTVEF